MNGINELQHLTSELQQMLKILNFAVLASFHTSMEPLFWRVLKDFKALSGHIVATTIKCPFSKQNFNKLEAIKP